MPFKWVRYFLLTGVFANLCLSGCNNAPPLVSNESGFDGAVAIISTEKEGLYRIVNARIPYLDIYGQPKEGQARLVIRQTMSCCSGRRPAFCHVHYELSVDSAKRWASEGWAVFTAVYNEQFPIDISPGDGNNLARAIIQWARRCPLVDPSRLHLDGGSQGGYMVLAMSADMFPVTSATADVPVVNWAYNLGYFEANRPLVAEYANPLESPLPVMAAVLQLADMCYQHFTSNLADNAWYRVSPISFLSRIANPVLVMCATGDMLVPMEQMTRTHIHPIETEKFSASYVRDFDSVVQNELSRHVFEELIPPEKVSIYIQPLQENSYKITPAMRLGQEDHPKHKPEKIDRVWSKNHQWNLYYLNEGPPEPYADHTTYAWNTSPDSYTAHYRDAAPIVDLLNADKLKWLLERYSNTMSNLPLLKNGTPIHRRNYDYVERLDVLEGLLTYAEWSEAHQNNLAALYAESGQKILGEAITPSTLRMLIKQLKRGTFQNNVYGTK